MLDDDRPINPNKQYLQQKEAELQNSKSTHSFLRKDNKNHLLPCQKYQTVKTKKINQSLNNKSKAQIYQEIKRKNIQKFGCKIEKAQQRKIVEQKRIKPNQMTVNYKAKPKIQLEQYKIKDKKTVNSCQRQDKKSQNVNGAKQKYEKLLQIIKQDQYNLNIKKSEFQKYQQSLKFKKQIENQETIPFIKTMRQQFSKRILKQKFKTHQQQNYINKQLENPSMPQQYKKLKKIEKSNKLLLSSQIVQFIDKANAQKQKIKQKLFQSNHRMHEGQNQITVKMYSIQNFNQIPKFDVQSTKQFIDLKMLQPKNNSYYKKAVAIFQNGLRYQNNEEVNYKISQKQTFTQTQIIQGLKAHHGQYLGSQFKETQQKATVKKVRMEGQKRIVKYDNNWMQVWHPGHQRLIAAPNGQYKIVWLRNGDIKQQWKSKGINSYYCKSKNLVKINFKNFQPIMYFIDLNQLQQSNKDRTEKQVLFRDGRIENICIN